MHPADQFEAFKALSDAGHGAEDVAARFGVTPNVVRQRLKLAAVSPALLALYRDDEMTLDQLMAFTVSDDHAAQEAAWLTCRNGNASRDAIRRRLTEAHVKADDRRARFVTVAAYVAAGGAVVTDLFQAESEGYLTDPALLDRLVNDRLVSEAETLRQEGWKWVEIMPDFAFDALRSFGEAKGKAQPLPPKQEKALAKAEKEADALRELDELTDEQVRTTRISRSTNRSLVGTRLSVERQAESEGRSRCQHRLSRRNYRQARPCPSRRYEGGET